MGKTVAQAGEWSPPFGANATLFALKGALADAQWPQPSLRAGRLAAAPVVVDKRGAPAWLFPARTGGAPGSVPRQSTPGAAFCRRARARSSYQARQAGLAIASRLTTFSSGWPSSSFLMGSSCFLPDSVRGISAT